tara:strand:+ start:233 stop:832 length:600 start_codon:yes stop_codon:yes gene_type:complete
MIAKEIYYYFKNALPHKLCDEIIHYGNSLIKEKAVTGLDKINPIRKLTNKEKIIPEKVRKSNVAWINEPWVYREIRPYLELANKQANWNFEINGYEPIQFTEYKTGQFYGYHMDSFYEGHRRKLSMTVNLTEGREYGGGDLYFKSIDRNKLEVTEFTNKEFRSKGTLCVFPSYEIHKVTPVTKGTRYSLVLWSVGDPFK